MKVKDNHGNMAFDIKESYVQAVLKWHFEVIILQTWEYGTGILYVTLLQFFFLAPFVFF